MNWRQLIIVRLLGRVRWHELTLHIANSRVMGGAAVNVTSTAGMLAGVIQVLGGFGSSNVVNGFGGVEVDALWGSMLVVQWLFVVAARWRERRGRPGDAVDGAWIELGGILMLAVVIAFYVVVVLKQPGGLDGRVFIALVLSAQVLNLIGRGLLLVRRVIWLERATQ